MPIKKRKKPSYEDLLELMNEPILPSDNNVLLDPNDETNKQNEEYFISLLSKIEIDLPSESDIQFLTQKGIFSPSTDICKITAGTTQITRYFLRDYDYKSPYEIYYSYKGKTYTNSLISKYKNRNYNRNSRSDFMIRPVLNFQNCPELFDLITAYAPKDIITFGSYPENIIYLQDMLNTLKRNKELTKTNDVYTFDGVNPEYLSADFKPRNYQAYETGGNKYIRMKIPKMNDNYIGPDGREDYIPQSLNYTDVNIHGEAWVGVDPIRWIVNRENKTLISIDGLVSGIQYMNYDKRYPNIDYETSNVKNFLVKFMLPQLLQEVIENKEIYITKLAHLNQEEIIEEVNEPVIEKKKENTKQDEITKLLEEIRDYKEYYLGDDDIDTKVKTIYEEYTNNLNELENGSGSKLYLEARDPKTLYRKLVLGLTEILEELKLHSTKVKSYYEMLDILTECRKAVIDVNKDQLCKEINDINDTIIGFNTDIKNKNVLIRNLDNILTNNIKRINSYINEFKRNINAKTKSLDELKEEFKKDLEPFKEHLAKVTECYKMIDILTECTKDNIDPNKDDICQSINNIKTVIFEFITDDNIRNDLNNKLNEILYTNINRINKYLEEKKEDIDLRKEFAEDFTPFLQELQRVVITQDVVNDIIKETKEMIENSFHESRIDIAKGYMKTLGEIIATIKEKGTKDDIVLLRSKIKYDFDITKNLDNVLTKLGEYIKEAYKIQLDIEERQEKVQAIDEVRVNVDVDSILNGHNHSK